MEYARDRRADVPLLSRAAATMASTFVTFVGCLIAITFLLTPWAAMFADFALPRLGCVPDYLIRNFPPETCVMQSNYQCEKSLANGTLKYSVTCTSLSSSGQFVGGNCSITGLSSSSLGEGHGRFNGRWDLELRGHTPKCVENNMCELPFFAQSMSVETLEDNSVFFFESFLSRECPILLKLWPTGCGCG